MKNLYHKTSLLTLTRFKEIEKALEKSWSKATTFPELMKEWNEENKALGQCAPTALVIYDLFGGKIIYDKQNFHLWNELPDGTQIDFSRSQFLTKKTFSIYKYKTKEDLLKDESAIKTDLLKRYTLLKQKIMRIKG